MSVTLFDVQEARRRIQDAIRVTPCTYSELLSQLCGCEVYCKLEHLQHTGSFKERGVCNALERLSTEEKQRGVIAASAGNHALALAYHGHRLHIPVVVVMPRFAPLIKQERCRQAHAELVLHGECFEDARMRAVEIARHRGLRYVHGYDDPEIIAGQGTIGLEVLEQCPDADAVLVPIGGAGLAAGVSLVIKELCPEIEVIGIEPERAASFSAAVAAGHPVRFDVQPTLADGLAVNQVGELAFQIARQHVDHTVLVDEQSIALAVVRLMELEKSVIEGAGAAPLAALIGNRLPELAGKRVILLQCGSNIDLSILNRLIETGLVASGRLTRFVATISDRPGGLAHFAALIADIGASIMDVAHDRVFAGPDVTSVNVLCTVETRNAAHIDELFQRLADSGIRHRRLDRPSP